MIATLYGYVYHYVFTRPPSDSKGAREFHYIGQHLGAKADRNYFGSGLRLKRLIRKYGIVGNLKRYGAMWCYSVEELDFAEILMIGFCRQFYGNDCLNLKHGGANGRMHESTKAKLRLSHLGRTFSAEHLENLRLSHLGKKHSAEHSAKISASNLGRTHSAETKLRMREAKLGKQHTEEAKAKMSAAKWNMSADTKAKISASKRGKPLSEEHKAKIGATRRASLNYSL